MTTIIHLGHPGFLPKYLVYCSKNGLKDCVYLADITFASPETQKFLSKWNENNSAIGTMITYRDSQFWVDVPDSEMEERVLSFYRDLFVSNKVVISENDLVFSSFDGLNSFGVYCNLCGIKYSLMSVDGVPFDEKREDSLCNPDECRYNGSASAYQRVMKKFRALSAYAGGVDRIICIGKHPADPRCEDFDYMSVLRDMDDPHYAEISSCFGIAVKELQCDYLIPLRSYASVVYSGYNFSKKQRDPQKFLRIYRRIADYVLSREARISLKAHPNYELLPADVDTIPNSSYIPGYYPFEFMLRDLADVNYLCIGGSESSMIGKGFLVLPESFFYCMDLVEPVMFCISLMKGLKAYPDVVDDGRIKRFKPLFDLLLNTKANISAAVMIADRASDEAINNLKANSKVNVLLVIHPRSSMPGSVMYRTLEIPTGSYKEEYTGPLSDFAVAVVFIRDPEEKRCLKEVYDSEMYRCGTVFHSVGQDASGNIDILKNLEPQGCLNLGRAYRDGRGIGVDLAKAADCMRKASVGIPSAKNELIDVLWRINTPESLKEMISVAAEFADKGDGGAMGRMGRAYRDGKGVSRDLVKAAEWMRKAKDRNVPWAEWELVGILWRIATVEALEEIRGIIDAEIVKKK